MYFSNKLFFIGTLFINLMFCNMNVQMFTSRLFKNTLIDILTAQ